MELKVNFILKSKVVELNIRKTKVWKTSWKHRCIKNEAIVSWRSKDQQNFKIIFLEGNKFTLFAENPKHLWFHLKLFAIYSNALN
jgi:hypothetical protein